jgi:hypothetical protein
MIKSIAHLGQKKFGRTSPTRVWDWFIAGRLIMAIQVTDNLYPTVVKQVVLQGDVEAFKCSELVRRAYLALDLPTPVGRSAERKARQENHPTKSPPAWIFFVSDEEGSTS